MYNDKARNLLVRKKIIDAAEGRLIGVIEEFSKSFDILEKHEKTVSIFGSARVLPETLIYKSAYNIAKALANQGYAIVTGGGGGVMEAANKGAYDIGKPSIGFNIELPTEQHLNSYTTEHYSFEHFFGRKVALTLNANAYVYLPGGFGTMDEMFEILTLIQTQIVPIVPFILYDSNFWQPILEFNNNILAKKYRTVDPLDLDIIKICNTVDEVVDYIKSRKDDALKLPSTSGFSELVS